MRKEKLKQQTAEAVVLLLISYDEHKQINCFSMLPSQEIYHSLVLLWRKKKELWKICREPLWRERGISKGLSTTWRRGDIALVFFSYSFTFWSSSCMYVERECVLYLNDNVLRTIRSCLLAILHETHTFRIESANHSSLHSLPPTTSFVSPIYTCSSYKRKNILINSCVVLHATPLPPFCLPQPCIFVTVERSEWTLQLSNRAHLGGQPLKKDLLNNRL